MNSGVDINTLAGFQWWIPTTALPNKLTVDATTDAAATTAEYAKYYAVCPGTNLRLSRRLQLRRWKILVPGQLHNGGWKTLGTASVL